MRGQDTEMWPRPPCYLLSCWGQWWEAVLVLPPVRCTLALAPSWCEWDKNDGLSPPALMFSPGSPPSPTHISLVGGIRIIQGDGRLPVPPQIPPTPFLAVGKEDALVAS